MGQRLPYQEARTVAIDEATGEWTFLPDGEVGTLVLRGPNIFAGYLVRGPSGTELRAATRSATAGSTPATSPRSRRTGTSAWSAAPRT